MIYFLTVNYYSADLISHLIQSIHKNLDSNYRIIIVNNSPEDNLICQLKNDLVLIIDAPQNLGFGRGCNLGTQYIYQQDNNALIWLINPDATLEPYAISYVEQCILSDPAIAILGTKIKDANGKMWFSSGNFNSYTGHLKQETSSLGINDLSLGITLCRWVCGCSLLINLARFDHCPTFDPYYFLYYEDADLCVRYHRKGYRIAITKSALVIHKVSSISSRNRNSMFEYFTYSKLYFLSQNASSLALLFYLSYLPLIFLPLLLYDYQSALGRLHGYRKFIWWILSKH